MYWKYYIFFDNFWVENMQEMDSPIIKIHFYVSFGSEKWQENK